MRRLILSFLVITVSAAIAVALGPPVQHQCCELISDDNNVTNKSQCPGNVSELAVEDCDAMLSESREERKRYFQENQSQSHSDSQVGSPGEDQSWWTWLIQTVLFWQ
jgi:hypothetical protein